MVEDVITLLLCTFLVQIAFFIQLCLRNYIRLTDLPELIWGMLRYNPKGYLANYMACFWAVCGVVVLYYCLPQPLKDLFA